MANALRRVMFSSSRVENEKTTAGLSSASETAVVLMSIVLLSRESTHPRSRSVLSKECTMGIPKTAVIPNFHLPMHNFKVKNRISIDEIKSLRLITAIKTPYLPDGRFNLEAYDTLVNMQIEDGADAVIVGGTTGEGQSMSWDEHIIILATPSIVLARQLRS